MKTVFMSTLLIFLLTISLSAYSAAQAEFNLIYVIQDGDTISEIAADYSVSTSQLMSANNLSSNSIIRVGQELLIPINNEPERKKWDYTFFSNNSSSERLGLDVGNVYSVRINPSQQLPDISQIPKDSIIKYHVGVGDTLYDIARDFNISIGVIMALNDMERSIIRAGTVIDLSTHNLSSRQVLAMNVNDQDLELLARAIFSEARGEPYIGQVAVGAVVINRVLSSDFPNDFREVIYQDRQFSAVADGQINLTPNQTAYRAARDALNGSDPTMGSLFYYNPTFAKNQWWFETRRLMVSIGQHLFLQ